MKNVDLMECRDKLDVIDREIVRLFEERMRICGDVAEYKIGTGKAVYDAEREKQKIAAVQEMAGSDFNKESVKEIFSQPQIPVWSPGGSRKNRTDRIL